MTVTISMAIYNINNHIIMSFSINIIITTIIIIIIIIITLPRVFSHNGRLLKEPVEIANAFNRYFIDIA